MSTRFKMDFNNNNNTPLIYRQLANALTMPQQIQKPVSLSSPMINRVYSAKPGCSACGKKVM